MTVFAEPVLRCTACGAPALRSEERIVDVTVDASAAGGPRNLGWQMRVKVYVHGPEVTHTLALEAIVPPAPSSPAGIPS